MRIALPKIFWRLAAAVAYTAVIFVGGSVPMRNPGPAGSDKVLHVGGFLLMFGLYFHVLYPNVETKLRRAIIWSVLATMLAGGILEIWQSFLPYRSADFADWAADGLGALLGAALVLTALRLLRRPVG